VIFDPVLGYPDSGSEQKGHIGPFPPFEDRASVLGEYVPVPGTLTLISEVLASK